MVRSLKFISYFQYFFTHPGEIGQSNETEYLLAKLEDLK